MDQPHKREKSRQLSAFEFYETIQIEYICAVLRATIYPKPKDKEYWNKVASGKKVTIETMSERNSLPSIFTDSDLHTALKRRIYRPNTYPQFIYRNEQQRQSQEYLDLLYYYEKGKEVRFDLNDEVKIAKVKEYKPGTLTMLVELLENGEEMKVEVSQVSRIL